MGKGKSKDSSIVFPIMTEVEAGELLLSNQKLQEWVENGHFIFADGYFVLAKPEYVTFINGKAHLTKEAKDNLPHCAIRLKWEEKIYFGGMSWKPKAGVHYDIPGVEVRKLIFLKSMQSQLLKAQVKENEELQKKALQDKSFEYKTIQDDALETISNDLLGNDTSLEFEKDFYLIVGDPDTSLCDCLNFFMKKKKWEKPAVFSQHTRIFRDYFKRIQNGEVNDMEKGTLMAICVGLEFDSWMIEPIFQKAGYMIKRYEQPWRSYIRLIGTIRGLSIPDINKMLEAENKRIRKENEKRLAYQRTDLIQEIPLLGTESLIRDEETGELLD